MEWSLESSRKGVGSLDSGDVSVAHHSSFGTSPFHSFGSSLEANRNRHGEGREVTDEFP